MMYIDLSKFNTVYSWAKVKASVDGIILRCGLRGYGSGKIAADSKFAAHAAKCKAYGIPFGVYFMSQAINATEAQAEADYACTMADKYGATLPVYIDSEDGDGTKKVVRADGLSKLTRTAVVKAFCKRVTSKGKVAGVYASRSWFISNLDVNQLLSYRIWVAQYNSRCTAKHRYDMWQYTSKGSVPGVIGKVDCNRVYNTVSLQVVTNQRCSIWASPATTEPNRTKYVDAGYPITLASRDVVPSILGDGKTFYKTCKGAYVLCKCVD
jgi:GH25 family lysozyme M1 (1,4-beta-N-acetylmuramidase)